MKTVVEKLFENADRFPDKLAVVFEKEEVTYGQLKEAIIRLASWFKLHGVEQGDRIIAQAEFGKWFISAYYAAHLCGAIIVPVEKRLTHETLQSVVDRMDSKVAVTWLDAAAPVSLNYGDIETELADVEEQPWTLPDLDLVANIMLTSGTTGTPKGAMLTQRNLAANCLVRIHELQFADDMVGITFLPLNNVGTSRLWDTAIYHGSTFIFLDGLYKMRKLFEFADLYHVKALDTTPSGVVSIGQLSQNRLHDFADQIELAYIHAAPIQEPQRAFLREMLPNSRLFYSYGSSENGTVSLLRFDQYDKEICCVGIPCTGVDISILDDGMNELPKGQQGRVAIRDEMNFKGYWDMPELTASVFHGDWFLSNDAGYLDEEGFLHILGRIDDVINIGGLKVHPSEIENVAAELEGVDECLCVDMPNVLTGRSAKLLVRLRDGAVLSARDIRTALMGKLDTYKVPASIELVDEIKKTPIGKPDRKFYRT